MRALDRILLDGKPHNMAREAKPFYEFLIGLDSVSRVGIGQFRTIGEQPTPSIIPQYYNEATGTYKIVAQITRFAQTFFVTVKHGRLSEFQAQTADYVLSLMPKPSSQ